MSKNYCFAGHYVLFGEWGGTGAARGALAPPVFWEGMVYYCIGASERRLIRVLVY